MFSHAEGWRRLSSLVIMRILLGSSRIITSKLSRPKAGDSAAENTSSMLFWDGRSQLTPLPINSRFQGMDVLVRQGRRRNLLTDHFVYMGMHVLYCFPFD